MADGNNKKIRLSSSTLKEEAKQRLLELYKTSTPAQKSLIIRSLSVWGWGGSSNPNNAAKKGNPKEESTKKGETKPDKKDSDADSSASGEGNTGKVGKDNNGGGDGTDKPTEGLLSRIYQMSEDNLMFCYILEAAEISFKGDFTKAIVKVAIPIGFLFDFVKDEFLPKVVLAATEYLKAYYCKGECLVSAIKMAMSAEEKVLFKVSLEVLADRLIAKMQLLVSRL